MSTNPTLARRLLRIPMAIGLYVATATALLAATGHAGFGQQTRNILLALTLYALPTLIHFTAFSVIRPHTVTRKRHAIAYAILLTPVSAIALIPFLGVLRFGI